MSGPTLKHAAEYVQSGKRPNGLMRFLGLIKRIYIFTQERSNRLVRFVVITRAYAKGAPVQDIVTQYGCTRGTVLRYARLAGLPKRPKHFPAEIRAAVIRDYKAKVPVAEIAKLHKVSQAYVSRSAKEEGISRYSSRKGK